MSSNIDLFHVQKLPVTNTIQVVKAVDKPINFLHRHNSKTWARVVFWWVKRAM